MFRSFFRNLERCRRGEKASFLFSASFEPVKVGQGPAEGNDDGIVELMKGNICRAGERACDARITDIVERDLKENIIIPRARALGRCWCCHIDEDGDEIKADQARAEQ